MKEKLNQIKMEALERIEKTSNQKELNDVRVAFLGKQGELTAILRGMRDVAPEERPILGAHVNVVRDELESAIKAKENAFADLVLQEKLKSEWVDITLPGLRPQMGAPHVVEKLVEEMEEIFMSMGYDVVDGPEVEEDYYNFELMNLPKGHPARDAQDTFYIEGDRILLRSHTSPVQARVMLEGAGKKPIRIICPGLAYRRDTDDAQHSHNFTQIEGLLVDKNITLANLKATFDLVAKKLFGEETQTRFRPSYYQFTEPSVETDVTCFMCKGKGCSLCKNTGWITVSGAGVVHPNVLRNCGYDPSVWSGFAFGFGAMRLAMLRYGINDMRKLFQTDLRETSVYDRRAD